MIDLTRAKQHLRVEASDEDTLIAGYLAAAISLVEVQTSKLLTQREVVQRLSGFPGADRPIRLWYGPVSGDVVTITYDDADGVEQPLADFRLVEGSTPRLLPAYGELWPPAQSADGSVRVTYTAGYADVPAELDQAVLLLVGHFYLNREAVTTGTNPAELPLAVEAMLRPYRPVGLG